MDEKLNYPKTVDEFIEQYKIHDDRDLDILSGGTYFLPVSKVKQMIEHYFSAKPKDLLAEDFVKAININIDMLINTFANKDDKDNSDEMTNLMLQYTKKFINEFVDTAVVKTEDEETFTGEINTLADTVALMTSNDYKDRFKAEYHQLLIRTTALENMVEKWDSGELNFTPTCPRSTYDLQLHAMNDYLSVLEMRAKLEEVDL